MTIQQIDPRRLPTSVRNANRDLLRNFIAADPYARGHLTRRQFILYNGRGHFRYAMPAKPTHRQLSRLFAQSAIRFWSHGI